MMIGQNANSCAAVNDGVNGGTMYVSEKAGVLIVPATTLILTHMFVVGNDRVKAVPVGETSCGAETQVGQAGKRTVEPPANVIGVIVHVTLTFPTVLIGHVMRKRISDPDGNEPIVCDERLIVPAVNIPSAMQPVVAL